MDRASNVKLFMSKGGGRWWWQHKNPFPFSIFYQQKASNHIAVPFSMYAIVTLCPYLAFSSKSSEIYEETAIFVESVVAEALIFFCALGSSVTTPIPAALPVFKSFKVVVCHLVRNWSLSQCLSPIEGPSRFVFAIVHEGDVINDRGFYSKIAI